MPVSANIAKEKYLKLRSVYRPRRIKLVIVAESPPARGTYFYDPSGRKTEQLFSALMKQIGCNPSEKREGLEEFKRKGWLLVDATYRPINRLRGAKRDKEIDGNYVNLRKDLLKLNPRRGVPLILLKANVCRILEPRLKTEFQVLNRGDRIYFPGHGRQKDFHRQFGRVLKRARF